MLELVVVLFIGVLLITLVVVGIGKMRERANRAHCANNLRQMGAAVKLYDKERLPPSRIAEGYATWAVLITPFMVKDSGLKDWDLERQYFDQPEAARQALIPQYFCPSRRYGPANSISGDVPGPGRANVAGALADYAGAAGDGNPRFPWTTARANGPLIIARVIRRVDGRIVEWQSRVRWADLTKEDPKKEDPKKGESHTILLGEKHVPLDHFGEAAFGDSSVFNGANPANFSRVAGPGYGLATSVTDPFNTNFGSYHPDICQFLMADGSVRPMNTSVSETVLGRLAVRGE
jgi:Protein of unknown function (DUF1559)